MKIKHGSLVLIIIFVIVIIAMVSYYSRESVCVANIADMTDEWITRVVSNDPASVAQLFCKDGNLLGTVSQMKRKNKDIMRYFDYFANLDDIRVTSREYNISRVSRGVYLNTAFISWMWAGSDEPLTTRMTFLYKAPLFDKGCLFQLHSSVLPDINDKLAEI